jgi:hypothetical protein
MLGGLEFDREFSGGLFGVPETLKGRKYGTGFGTLTGKDTRRSFNLAQAQPQALEQESIISLKPIITPTIIPRIVTPRPRVPRQIFDTTSILPAFGLGWGLGGIETGGGQKGIKKRKKATGKVAYNPSLGSILLKQKKLKVTKSQAIALGRQTFSGFEMRPELEITNKKKKSIFNIF